MTTTETTQCEHEDIDTVHARNGDRTRTCLDCGEVLEEDGPDDDSWYHSSLERAAGVGEPDRRYYDSGRLIDPARGRGPGR
jgi:hypothetical protein